jgi:MoaA/NifB/PqqE/SkfB family radical SAM enzyme
MITAERIQDRAVMTDLSFLWLEITAKCNLMCSHCYAESGPQGELYGNMNYGDWTRVLDETAELGCRSVQFIGGEPTMHPRLHDLVDHANHRGFDFIEVYTNATRLGKELMGCFQRYRVHVATSFYTDDPVVHENVTLGKGSWERTVHGIESVLAAGLPIRVGVIETERNLGHGPRAIKFLKAMGVHSIGMDRERGVGRGHLVHLGGDGERYEELCGDCWKGKLCVTSSGEVFPCVFSRATGLGDVKAGLLGILQTAKLTAFRQKVRSMHECGDSNLPETLGQACNPCPPGGCSPCPPGGCSPCPPGGCSPCPPGRTAPPQDPLPVPKSILQD